MRCPVDRRTRLNTVLSYFNSLKHGTIVFVFTIQVKKNDTTTQHAGLRKRKCCCFDSKSSISFILTKYYLFVGDFVYFETIQLHLSNWNRSNIILNEVSIAVLLRSHQSHHYLQNTSYLLMILSTKKKSSCASCVQFGIENHSNHYSRRGVICDDLHASIQRIKYLPTRMGVWMII